jgi:septin family protein
MCCDGKDFIMIHCGRRGCGKSEHARKVLGMTHDEYEKHGKFIEELLEMERKHRELMEKLSTLMVGEMILRISEEMRLNK